MQENSGTIEDCWTFLRDCNAFSEHLNIPGIDPDGAIFDGIAVEPQLMGLENLDSNSLMFQESDYLVEKNTPLIRPGEYDVVDVPQNLGSLIEILGADVKANRHPSSPPESDDWKGDYGFDVDFTTETSNANCVYSAERDKLYILRDAPWAAKFICTIPVPSDSQIRVTAVFSEPDQAHYDVHRCLDHAKSDFENGEKACDHLIRCDNNPVMYVRNTLTLRRSLIVPYKSPSTGQVHSVYIFKFMCLNSCRGGINRRPVKIICTLENSGVVVGRRSFEVKVCTCPRRDIRDDDKCMNRLDGTKDKNSSSSKKRKIRDGSYHCAEMLRFVDKVLHVAQKDSHDRQNVSTDGPYHIKVRDAKERRVLMLAKLCYEFKGSIDTLCSNMQSFQTNPAKKPKKRKD